MAENSDSDVPDATVDFKDREAFDDADRELCPDGNCTGLIDSDGKCKVCGTSSDGSRADVPAGGTRDDDTAHAEDAGDALHADAALDDDDRQLCPDGNCVGLIGSDGKCKVCGHLAAS